MAQDIKRKIVLEGEKEYSAALKEIQRNLKTMRSELKAESAELGKNATEQQKAETRAKSAAKQIKEQERAVKTCEEALAKVKKEYADNEDVIAKWEQKLNDARATLARMKDGLMDMGDGFRQAKSDADLAAIAAKNVGDAMGQIGSVGESISGAIEGVFFGMIQTIEHAVSAMWDMVTDAAAKANGWEDIAGYWNTDTQTIQQYARAVAASGNAFDQLNSAVSRIVLGGKNKEITEMLQISDANYVNDWEYAIGVLNRIHDLQKEGQDMTPIFQEVFGEKKSTQVMDLLNDWDTITGLLDTFNGDKGGFGLTTEALDSMAALHVQIETVEEKWDALVTKFSDGLGTATGTLLVNVEGGLDAVNNYMNATTQQEREQALEDLRANVEEFFHKVGEILREGIAILGEVGQELQESDDPVVRAIGGILTALRDALEWIVNNQKRVEEAFYAIFAVCLMGHITAAAGKLAALVKDIEAIQAFKGFTNLGGAAGGGAVGAAGAANKAATGGAAGDYTTSWIDKSLSVGTFFNSLKEKTATLLKTIGTAAKEAAPYAGFAATVAGAATLVDASGTKATQDLLEEMDDLTENREEIDELSQALKVLGKAYRDVVAGEGDIKSALNEVNPEILRQAIPESDMFKQLDQWYGGDWGKFIDEQPGTTLLDWVEEFAYAVVGKAHQVDAEKPEEGEEIAETIKEAIIEATDEATEEFGLEQPKGPEPTDEQKDAAEAFWDIFRHSLDGAPDAFDELLAAFEGSDELLSRLDALIGELENSTADDGWRSIENLPANWWLDAANWQNSSGNNNGITSADLQGFRSLPGNMAAAVQSGAARGVSGIKVVLDGATVGRLVAPYVSETIARDVII